MSQTANRFTAAFLAILIQALFLALLILSRLPFTRPQNLVHELTFILPRLTMPKTETPPAPEARGRPRPLVPAPAIAPSVSLPPTSATPSPDLSGLGQSIFGCDLGTLSSLTPEQRARCPHAGDGAAGQASDPLGTRSHVQDYAHWQAELAARKSIRVPCTSIEGLAHGAQALMVDPICAMKELEELGKKLR